jgi:GrpB-like predicted nucleotidyltransferase (UPF0157 family)
MTEESIFLVPYNPLWPEKFQKEKKLIEETIGDYIAGGIHHVGSTAIPGLSAKPVIDILVGVESLDKSRPCIKILEKIHYVYFPYKEKYEHWFCKPSPEHREFHLHIMPADSAEFKAKIAFRDYLISHPEEKNRYESLKKELVGKFRNDREAYTDAKTDFVKKVVTKALGSNFKFET